jgi:hypothetical protein
MVLSDTFVRGQKCDAFAGKSINEGFQKDLSQYPFSPFRRSGVRIPTSDWLRTLTTAPEFSLPADDLTADRAWTKEEDAIIAHPFQQYGSKYASTIGRRQL